MKKFLFLGAFMAIISAQAQDRVFTYTYQSNVLGSGQKELEVWTTLGTARKDYFLGVDHRLEFEVGLGGNLQTSFYLNYGYSKGITSVNGSDVLNIENSYSFSNEWKLKLTDPVADKMGSALYVEYLIAPDATELEGKLILDKQSGRFLNALNVVGEMVFGKAFVAQGSRIKAETEKEYKVELNYGLSCKLKDNWYGGLEVMNENVFKAGTLEYSILTAGPGVSYSTPNYWVNFTLMPQIANLKDGGRELIEHDGLQVRLLFSYVF